MHHLCAAEHPWLKWIGTDKIEGRKCFDCWLLEAQLRKTVHSLQVAVYYKQLTDWSRATPSPFAIGAFLATAAIPTQAVVKTTERARLPPASCKCKVCKAGGDGLLACSFCTAVYHNSEACLGEAQVVNEALAKSASFPWHASRRASPPSSGRRSSRWVSARPAPRSRARSAQRSEQFARLCGSETWHRQPLNAGFAVVGCSVTGPLGMRPRSPPI